MSVSRVVPDKTLVDWLFEAMNYDSFIYERSPYEQELIYYRALDYQGQLYDEYINGPYVEGDGGTSDRFKKLKDETYYENLEKLIRQLRPLVKPEIAQPQSPPASDEPGLTVREQMLIHCYEGRAVINKGEPRYSEYIIFATPRKRMAYPGGSPKKAKSLADSIKKVIPYLSKIAAQQANSEIVTIEAKSSDPVATG